MNVTHILVYFIPAEYTISNIATPNSIIFCIQPVGWTHVFKYGCRYHVTWFTLQYGRVLQTYCYLRMCRSDQIKFSHKNHTHGPWARVAVCHLNPDIHLGAVFIHHWHIDNVTQYYFSSLSTLSSLWGKIRIAWQSFIFVLSICFFFSFFFSLSRSNYTQ